MKSARVRARVRRELRATSARYGTITIPRVRSRHSGGTPAQSGADAAFSRFTQTGTTLKGAVVPTVIIPSYETRNSRKGQCRLALCVIPGERQSKRTDHCGHG